MPSRIIRDGWLESERIDQLTADEERFFLRLCLRADDFGRYHAHPNLLRSNLFPLKTDVRSTDIPRWLAACEKAGLLRCYEIAGQRCVEIPRFEQRTRAMRSKFPAPPTNAGQMTVTCPSHAGHPRTESESESDIGVAVVPAPSAEGSAGRGGSEHQTDFLNPAKVPPASTPPAVSTRSAPQMPADSTQQPPPTAPAPADPRHHAVTSAWGDAFSAAFGVDYQFSGRDAKTLKRWLTTSKATADEILATARAAWDRTKVDRYARNCKEAATIHGLCTHYNEIRVEVQSPPLGSAPARQGAPASGQSHARTPTVWELREREKAILDALRDLSDGRRGQVYVGMRPGHTSAYEWTPEGRAEQARLNDELKTVRAALAAAPAAKQSP